MGQVLEVVLPLLAEIEAGDLLELGELPADDHAQAEGGDFASPGEWGEIVEGLDGGLGLFEAFAVGAGVRPVLPAASVDEARGAGAESIELAAAPVIDVVPASPVRKRGTRGGVQRSAGEVGDFVLDESVLRGDILEVLVERAGEIVIGLADGTGVELAEQRGIFLVSDFVAGEMLALECGGLPQGLLPVGAGLAREGEDQVEVDVVEAGIAEDVECAQCLVARVDPAEPFELAIVEGLDAEGDPVDAAGAEEAGLFRGDRAGVAFDGPFGGSVGDMAVEAGQEGVPRRGIEQGGGAAAEVDGQRFGERRDRFEFACEGPQVAVDEMGRGWFGVESAVTAFPRAERNVNVDTSDRSAPRRAVGRGEFPSGGAREPREWAAGSRDFRWAVGEAAYWAASARCTF